MAICSHAKYYYTVHMWVTLPPNGETRATYAASSQMILKRYFEVLGSDTKKGQHDKVLLVVHLLNKEGAKLVVDWPKWASSDNYFGAVIRVFGVDADLVAARKMLIEHFSAQKRKPKSQSAQQVQVGEIADVPRHAVATWMFIRDRHRRPPSYFVRRDRRAKARGQVAGPVAVKKGEEHCLMIVSVSKNTVFPMMIKRIRPKALHLQMATAEPNSYGLNVPVPRF